MLYYDISPRVEAFSTEICDSCSFDVVMPQHQGHTALVRKVPEELGDITGVDALITDRRGLRIGVKSADCVPILLFDPVCGAVAAIHSGWKGTLKNIAAAASGRMSAEFGTRPCDLKAVIGPCIHMEAFEVGEELVNAFCPDAAAIDSYPFAKMLPHPQTGIVRWHLDLPGICRSQLLECGIPDGNIEMRPECTWEQHSRFFSARWLGKNFGEQRIISCIMLLD